MSERAIFKDLTIYDVFLGVVGHKSITLERLANVMWLTEDSNVEQCLEKLLDMKLLIKKGDEYSSSNSAASQDLFSALSFALSENLDYNFYLSDNMRTLLANVYGRNSFNISHCEALSKNTIHTMVRRLCMENLAIILDYAPMSAKLVSSHFYDLLCAYWKITPKKAGFFERKVKIDTIIMEYMLARSSKDKGKLVSGSKIFFSPKDNSSVLDIPTSKLQNLLKYDVIPNNPDIFDSQQTDRTKMALAYQEQLVERMRPLTLEILEEYHSLSMFGNKESHPYRTFEVQIGNNVFFKTCPAQKIEAAMNQLIFSYKYMSRRATNVPKALELAAFVYNEIIYIQPYEDGNSRLAMLALTHILKLFRTGVTEIPSSYSVRFLQVTKGARKRNNNALIELLTEIALLNINKEDLRDMLEYL